MVCEEVELNDYSSPRTQPEPNFLNLSLEYTVRQGRQGALYKCNSFNSGVIERLFVRFCVFSPKLFRSQDAICAFCVASSLPSRMMLSSSSRHS